MILHLYGLVIGVGIVVAMTVAERVGEGKLPVWEAFWYMVLPALVGARLYHVVDQWGLYRQDPGEIVRVWEGGLGIWGAIAGGMLGLGLFSYLRAKKMETKVTEELFVMGDIFGLILPLAQAIGRWGNYFNNELWGEGESPLFGYESGLNLLLFVILLIVYRRQVRGSTLGSYLVGYGVIRIFLEPLRTDSWSIGGWGAAQWAGLTAAVMGVMILRRKGRKVWE